MARSLSKTGKGFRSNNRQCSCLGARRPHPNPHAATRKSLKSNEIIMSRTLSAEFIEGGPKTTAGLGVEWQHRSVRALVLPRQPHKILRRTLDDQAAFHTVLHQ